MNMSINEIKDTLIIAGGFITIVTFIMNRISHLDLLFSKEHQDLVNNDAMEIFYKIDIEYSGKNLEDIALFFKDNEKMFDRMLLKANRIARLSLAHPIASRGYFKYFFETLSNSEVIQWYLAGGTFKENEKTKAFLEIYQDISKYFRKKTSSKQIWQDIKKFDRKRLFEEHIGLQRIHNIYHSNHQRTIRLPARARRRQVPLRINHKYAKLSKQASG